MVEASRVCVLKPTEIAVLEEIVGRTKQGPEPGTLPPAQGRDRILQRHSGVCTLRHGRFLYALNQPLQQSFLGAVHLCLGIPNNVNVDCWRILVGR